MVRPRVFFDFQVDGSPIGRVVFELFNDEVPKTCENFRALATGEKGISPLSQIPLYYKGSTIHRSIANFMVQGGDFTKRNGSGGESIYGAPFEDESLTRTIDSEGLLVMANRGPNTNGSQFFVSLRACPHLDGKHVTFGRVVSGYDVVTKISEIPVDAKDRPNRPVVVANCGELQLLRKAPPKKRSASVSSEQSVAASRPASPTQRKSPSEQKPSKSKKERHRRKHKRRDSGSDEDNVESGSDADRPKKKRDKVKNKPPREETEEELDARLEREELERKEEERKKRIEEVQRKRMEARSKETPSGGLKLKGRGTMRYRDPELDSRR